MTKWNMTEGQTTVDNKVISTGEIITPFYEDTNITELEKKLNNLEKKLNTIISLLEND
jgi:hypothetical protein